MTNNEDKKSGTYEDVKYFENDVKCFRSYKNFVLVAEEWFKNNKLNRDEETDLPALIWFYENGNKRQEVWCRDGLPYRKTCKTAWVEYDENGRRKYGAWYYENGNKAEEVWSQDSINKPGQPHRIEYYENGKEKAKHWKENGRLYSESISWKENDENGDCEIFGSMKLD